MNFGILKQLIVYLDYKEMYKQIYLCIYYLSKALCLSTKLIRNFKNFWIAPSNVYVVEWGKSAAHAISQFNF